MSHIFHSSATVLFQQIVARIAGEGARATSAVTTYHKVKIPTLSQKRDKGGAAELQLRDDELIRKSKAPP
ncbi:MAG TPA: hypothetical protein VN950_13225 [Terriglobales bacterium]|nr:hypothetical protein [Terriglobales bacterium]